MVTILRILGWGYLVLVVGLGSLSNLVREVGAGMAFDILIPVLVVYAISAVFLAIPGLILLWAARKLAEHRARKQLVGTP